jgi:hypothetical protein
MIRKMWEGLLGKEGLSIASVKEVKDIIEDLIIPDKINPLAFSSNYEALLRGGIHSTEELLGIENDTQRTQSLSHFTFVANRPLAFPLWFIAAYPDVLLWFENAGEEYIETHGQDEDGLTGFHKKVLGIDPANLNLKEKDLIDSKGNINSKNLKNLVQSYKDETGKELETAIKSPADDIYLGSELLKAFGAENNFILIAMNTTKYYLELTRNYSNRFSNESTILATAGLLDAQFYVVIQGIMNLSEILDIAKKSALLGEEALIDFIINLEIRIFKIDSPDIDISEIQTVCLGQKKIITEAIQETKKQYVSEPVFASFVSDFMNSSQFKPFRQMLGVND